MLPFTMTIAPCTGALGGGDGTGVEFHDGPVPAVGAGGVLHPPHVVDQHVAGPVAVLDAQAVAVNQVAVTESLLTSPAGGAPPPAGDELPEGYEVHLDLVREAVGGLVEGEIGAGGPLQTGRLAEQKTDPEEGRGDAEKDRDGHPQEGSAVRLGQQLQCHALQSTAHPRRSIRQHSCCQIRVFAYPGGIALFDGTVDGATR